MKYEEIERLNRYSWIMAAKAFTKNFNGRYEIYSNKRINDFAACVGKPNMIKKIDSLQASYTPPPNEHWRGNTTFERELVSFMKEVKDEKYLNLFFRYLRWNSTIIEKAYSRHEKDLIWHVLKTEEFYDDKQILAALSKINIQER